MHWLNKIWDREPRHVDGGVSPSPDYYYACSTTTTARYTPLYMFIVNKWDPGKAGKGRKGRNTDSEGGEGGRGEEYLDTRCVKNGII